MGKDNVNYSKNFHALLSSPRKRGSIEVVAPKLQWIPGYLASLAHKFARDAKFRNDGKKNFNKCI